jgi:hypothetical protein
MTAVEFLINQLKINRGLHSITYNGGDWRSKSLALHLMAFILPIAC